jgi:hypothetical protein
MKTENVQSIIRDVDYLWQWFLDNEGIGGSLTGTYRRRLVGVGVHNNGFIDKAFDIAVENPQFMPAHFDVETLTANMHDIEDLRQFTGTSPKQGGRSRPFIPCVADIFQQMQKASQRRTYGNGTGERHQKAYSQQGGRRNRHQKRKAEHGRRCA